MSKRNQEGTSKEGSAMAKPRPMNLVPRNLLSTKKDSPQDMSDSNSPLNAKVEHGGVTAFVWKLTRDTSQNPAMYSASEVTGWYSICQHLETGAVKWVFELSRLQATGARCLQLNEQVKDEVSQHTNLKQSILGKGLQTSEKTSWRSRRIHQKMVLKHWKPMYWCGDGSCRQQWKQPYILDRTTLRFWKYTRTRTSRKFRIYSVSLRSWCGTILMRFWMWNQLSGQLHHGRDLHCLMSKVMKWTKPKVRVYSDAVLSSSEGVRPFRSKSKMGKA